MWHLLIEVLFQSHSLRLFVEMYVFYNYYIMHLSYLGSNFWFKESSQFCWMGVLHIARLKTVPKLSPGTMHHHIMEDIYLHWKAKKIIQIHNRFLCSFFCCCFVCFVCLLCFVGFQTFHAISVRESLTFFCEMLVTIRIPELPFVYYFIIILNLTWTPYAYRGLSTSNLAMAENRKEKAYMYINLNTKWATSWENLIFVYA